MGLYALRLAEETRSSLVVGWLIRFGHALTGRYPDLADAAAFAGELRRYVRKAAPLRLGELP